MLRDISKLTGYVLAADDGEIGRCHDFLFDDQQWAVRYMVADTGKWLPGRRVLVSPIALGQPDWNTKRFPVKLTRKKIEESPPLEKDAPVSRQYEMRWMDYYGWPYYWLGGGLWGPVSSPMEVYGKTGETLRDEAPNPEESHLRSVKEVTGYNIQATDGEIGYVDDFLVEDTTWSLRYLVVDTRKWLPGRPVLLAPAWVSLVEWVDRKVSVNLTSEQVKNSPEYESAESVTADYEHRLHQHYGLPIEKGLGPL